MKKLFYFLFILILFPNLSNAQWEQVPTSPPGYFQNILVVNNTIYASHYSSGIYKSTDGMESWQQINNGLNTTQSKSISEILSYNGNLYASTRNGIYKSTNEGNEWVKKSNGITIGPGSLYEDCESIFEYNGTLFTGTWNGIYRSTDNAENWILTNISGEGIKAKNFILHDGILFAARESINDPNGYKSFDNGITWLPLTGLTLNTITFLSEPGKLWAGTIVGIWFSTDDGLNWTIRNNGLTSDPYSSSIIRINGDLITSLKFGGSGVYRSSNDGMNWEDFGDGLPFLNSIDKLIVNNNKIIAATSSGLWQRDISQIPVELTSFTAVVSGKNVNLSWSTATETNNNGFDIERLQDSNIEKLKDLSTGQTSWEKIGFVSGHGTTTETQTYSFTDNNLNPGKYSYRLKQIDYDGTFKYSKIAVAEIFSADGFDLSQNYPNPFNPVTKIKFTIPAAGTQRTVSVQLEVYDILGRKIATLINEEKEPGEYSVQFDGKNLTSGIYIYSLQAGNFIETKKMLLLK